MGVVVVFVLLLVATRFERLLPDEDDPASEELRFRLGVRLSLTISPLRGCHVRAK